MSVDLTMLQEGGKAVSAISWQDEGIRMLLTLVSWKARRPISVRRDPGSNSTNDSLLHKRKHATPMTSTLDGIMTLSIFENDKTQSSSTVMRQLAGNKIVRTVDLRKHFGPMD